MSDEQFQKIKDAAWRRELTRDEMAALQEFLKTHPESQDEWSADLALSRLLEHLPPVPVSNNFTARVLQAAKTTPVPVTWRNWFSPALWLPQRPALRVAMCSMLICVGLVSYHEVELVHRARVARELARVSRVAALPPMDWFKDFDTIKAMSQVKVADDDLLAALQ